MIDTAKHVSPCLVVSQPMYFPWIGMLQQVKLCDKFVYLEDVQFSKGGFSNRVQIKTAQGIKWLSVPLLNFKLGQKINEVKIDNRRSWKLSQRDQLRQAYKTAPFYKEMLDLVDNVFSTNYESLAELSKSSTNTLIKYFEPIGTDKSFIDSPSLDISSEGSQRVLDICGVLRAKTYLTGHGARNYLNHIVFEKGGISVAYIDYQLDEYPQLHGTFTPYVSALDLVANLGRDGAELINGRMVPWRNFLSQKIGCQVGGQKCS